MASYGTSAAPFVPRIDRRTSAQGLITETFPRQTGVANTASTTGTIYGAGVYLFAGEVVTNLSIIITTAANTSTFAKVCLYDTAGNRLAISADQGLGWDTGGLKTVALTAPYLVPVTGWYYAAYLSVATTGPSTCGSNGTAAALLAMCVPVGAGFIPWFTVAAQTDLVNPVTIAAGAAPTPKWIGLS